MARNTRTFSDLDLNFTAHPVTGDINIRYDADAIIPGILDVLTHYDYWLAGRIEEIAEYNKQDVVKCRAQESFDAALAYEQAARFERTKNEVRGRRSWLLAECDWTQLADAPLTDEKKTAYVTYRQALRDVPEQVGFPNTIDWPVDPLAPVAVVAEAIDQ